MLSNGGAGGDNVDYSLLTRAHELKIVRLPTLKCLCKCFGDFRVLCELK